MIAHGKEIKVFTGNSNPELAKAICSELFMSLGNSAVTQFADGRALPPQQRSQDTQAPVQ